MEDLAGAGPRLVPKLLLGTPIPESASLGSCQSLVEQEIEGLLSPHWAPTEILSVCAENVFLFDSLNHALELRPFRPVSNELFAMAK